MSIFQEIPKGLSRNLWSIRVSIYIYVQTIRGEINLSSIYLNRYYSQISITTDKLNIIYVLELHFYIYTQVYKIHNSVYGSGIGQDRILYTYTYYNIVVDIIIPVALYTYIIYIMNNSTYEHTMYVYIRVVNLLCI